MKKLYIILITVLLFISSTYSQQFKDIINLKTGESIKCIIQKVDTIDYSLTYVDIDRSVQRVISLDYVGSYSIDGVVNAGLPVVVGVPLTSIHAPVPEVQVTMDAGGKLIQFANQAQGGIVVMLFGSVISTASLFINANDNGKYTTRNIVAGVGVTTSLIGYIIHISSYSKARDAGKILKFNANQDGIGIAMPIK